MMTIFLANSIHEIHPLSLLFHFFSKFDWMQTQKRRFGKSGSHAINNN